MLSNDDPEVKKNEENRNKISTYKYSNILVGSVDTKLTLVPLESITEV